jgi:hypothetical protein
MAIRKRGSRQEYAFTKFHGNGQVDAINLVTGKNEANIPLTAFTADGGTNEIIREVRSISRETDQKLRREENNG